jgi:methionyl aminopeptidase
LAGEVLHLTGKRVKPGVTPLELDEFAETWIREQGHIPTFKGYLDFPNTLCISINDQIVHGIPNAKPLQIGDIVSIDVGVTVTERFKNNVFKYIGDNAFTFPCGQVSPKVARLLEHTNQGLWAGIDAIAAGKRISDISRAVESIALANRYGNVKEFGGHGVGPSYHSEPFIPNFADFFKHYKDTTIQVGMVLAIEPMFNLGSSNITKHRDGWTIVTADRKASAHFEHEVLVKADGIEVITDVLNTRGWSLVSS